MANPTRAEMAEWAEAEAAVLAKREADGMEPLARLFFNLLDALALEYRGEGHHDRYATPQWTPAGLAAAKRVRGEQP